MTRWTLLILAALSQSACVALTGGQATQAALRQAEAAGFASELVEGQGFKHEVFSRGTSAESLAHTLWVFIEGDGSPWTDGGAQVASDPTARNPLALRLAMQTPGAVLYLGRPCYLRARDDQRCTPAAWTSARYSNDIVVSMNAALSAIVERNSMRTTTQRVVLVGYSGGGALAILMAQTLSKVAAVVTIAGNLDTSEWAKQHRYEPLSDSRNPADEAPLAKAIVELHLRGAKDDNVTSAMTAKYLARLPMTQIWSYEQFSHVCCWEQTWPEIFTRIDAALSQHR